MGNLWHIIWFSVLSACLIQTSNSLNYNGHGFTEIPSGIPLDVDNLHLSDNNLTVFDDGAFSAFTSMTGLYVNNNKLFFISQTAFSETKIQRLQLMNNVLTEFPNLNAIKKTLRTLKLSYNKIQYVPEELIERHTDLRNLELDGNPLVLVTDFYFYIPQLVTLNLRAIEFHCCWRMANLKSYAGKVLLIDEYPCSRPDHLINIPWRSIQATELEEIALCCE